jgi:phage shock protein A
MFSTLMTIVRGRNERARDQLESTHAVLILEQKIREAEQGHNTAKRSLATMIIRERNEARALTSLNTRITDLEARAMAALDAEMDALAQEAAGALADLESERDTRNRAVDKTRMSTQRLRLMIEKCQRRLIELRQGLHTARSMDAERISATALRGDIAGAAALVEGEAVLKRVLESADVVEELDILDQLNAELDGDDLVDRLAASGLGAPVRTRGEDVLSRLRSQQQDK